MVGFVGVRGTEVPCRLVLESDPTSFIPFNSFPLEEGITEGYNADYTKLGEKQAGEPNRRTWRGGDWQPISLTLNFRAGMNPLERGNSTEQAIARMLTKVRWIEASSFPRPDTYTPVARKALPSRKRTAGSAKIAGGTLSGLKGRPPHILFQWGVFMTLRGRVPAWTVNWQAPFEPISGKPHGAVVTFTFQIENGFFPNWYSVNERGAGMVPGSIVGLV
jgi:hypothetical protein